MIYYYHFSPIRAEPQFYIYFFQNIFKISKNKSYPTQKKKKKKKKIEWFEIINSCPNYPLKKIKK